MSYRDPPMPEPSFNLRALGNRDRGLSLELHVRGTPESLAVSVMWPDAVTVTPRAERFDDDVRTKARSAEHRPHAGERSRVVSFLFALLGEMSS